MPARPELLGERDVPPASLEISKIDVGLERHEQGLVGVRGWEVVFAQQANEQGAGLLGQDLDRHAHGRPGLRRGGGFLRFRGWSGASLG